MGYFFSSISTRNYFFSSISTRNYEASYTFGTITPLIPIWPRNWYRVPATKHFAPISTTFTITIYPSFSGSFFWSSYLLVLYSWLHLAFTWCVCVCVYIYIYIYILLNTCLYKYKHVIRSVYIYIYIYIVLNLPLFIIQAAVVSILLYGCTTWTLTKRLERKLDGNYTRMLRAVLNKSWRQHPTRLQLYGHLPPITKTIQVRRTRHAGHCWRSKDELISDVLLWTPTYGCAKVGRPARTYIQQLCEDTGCNPEDLPEAMNDREKWRERVRDIRAGGATWWWWLK